MRPTLFSLHLGGSGFGVHTYGLAVATGLGLGIVLAVRRAVREGFPRIRFIDLAFWTIVIGVAVSRALYVALNAHAFVVACRGAGMDGATRTFGRVVADCTYALRFWEGGLVFYGGVLGAAGVLVYFSRKEGWSLGHLADLFAPGLALGHALGRLGCFSAGCCFGKPSHAPWAVAFPPESVAFRDLATHDLVDLATGRTVPLHPTQLYESLAELAIFAALILAQRTWSRRAESPGRPSTLPSAATPWAPRFSVPRGRLFALYLALYTPVRFALEIFRGDAERKFLWPLHTPGLARALGLPATEPLMFSTSQAVSVLLSGAVLAWWWRRARKSTGAP